MTKTNHPIEQEELMAYLDGELATARAVTAAAHLEHCQECQRLVADLKGVSQKLMEWEVEASDTENMTDIASALEEREKQPEKTAVSDWRGKGVILRGRRRVWVGAFAMVALLVLAVSIPNWLRSRNGLRGYYAPRDTFTYDAEGRLTTAPQPPPPRSDRNGAAASAGKIYTYDSLNHLNSSGYMDGALSSPRPETKVRQLGAGDSGGTTGKLQSKNQAIDVQKLDDEAQSGDDLETVKSDDLTTSNGPLIVRTAGLTVTTKEFDKARIALGEILKRHHGYIGELNVSAPSEAGRTLTAALRMPSDQLDATMTELKTLGRIEGESQGGEEVTQQYVDLQARLANAKHTEQRLTDILRQRTGKLSDVLAVELQIGRVRGEIERMQAEKKELAKQVQFATLNTTVKEDYKAPLQMAPPSTSNRFHNAAVDGYRSVVEGLVDVVLFLLSSGPSLLVWAVILFFPVRWAWRKLKKNLVKPDAPAVS